MEIDAPDVQQTTPATPKTEVVEQPTIKIVPVPKQVAIERDSLLEQVHTLEVVDQESFERMANLQVIAKALEEKIEHHYEITLGLSAVRAGYNALIRSKKEALDKVVQSKQEASRKNGTFQAKQEQLRLEAQRKRDEEANRQAEEQRKRELEAAAKAGASKKELKALKEEPIMVAPPPAVEPTFEKAAGVSKPIEDWSAAPADGDESKALIELAKAVVAGKQPTIAILPNQKYLDQQARSLKGLLRIPGWKAVVNYRTSTRTTRR